MPDNEPRLAQQQQQQQKLRDMVEQDLVRINRKHSMHLRGGWWNRVEWKTLAQVKTLNMVERRWNAQNPMNWHRFSFLVESIATRSIMMAFLVTMCKRCDFECVSFARILPVPCTCNTFQPRNVFTIFIYHSICELGEVSLKQKRNAEKKRKKGGSDKN